MENALNDKVEMTIIGDVIERINKLEDAIGIDELDTTNRSLEDDEEEVEESEDKNVST
jgi:hypothetical protein